MITFPSYKFNNINSSLRLIFSTEMTHLTLQFTSRLINGHEAESLRAFLVNGDSTKVWKGQSSTRK